MRVHAIQTAVLLLVVFATGCSPIDRPTGSVEARLLMLVDQVRHVSDVTPATARRIFGVTVQPRGHGGDAFAYYGLLEDGTPIAIDIRSGEHSHPDSLAWSIRRPRHPLPERPSTCLVSFDAIAAALRARGFVGKPDPSGPWEANEPEWARGIWAFHRDSTRVVVWQFAAPGNPVRRCVNNFGVQVDSADPGATYHAIPRRPMI